jgi:hypothetical protein
MNTTRLGKILVLVNLVLSVLFAVWALGIYANRIDWPGTGSPTIPGEKALGELRKRDDEIKEYSSKANKAGIALSSWRAWNARLAALEAARPAAQAQYSAKLQSLDDGQGPVTGFVFDQQGRLGNGPEVPGAGGQPLRSRTIYQQQTAAAEKQIEDLNKQANQDLHAAEDQTVQLNGVREGDQVKQKGLRDLLREEQVARQNALDEIEYVRPFRYNRQAEGALLQKRQATLVERLEELKKQRAAAR